MSFAREYVHASAVVDKSGRTVCTACGTELNSRLMSSVPCTVPTVSYVQVNDFCFFINVWNANATLSAMRRDGTYLTPCRVSVASDIGAEIEQDIQAAVDAEGAINISGHYSIPDSLARKIVRYLEEGKIVVEPVPVGGKGSHGK